MANCRRKRIFFYSCFISYFMTDRIACVGLGFVGLKTALLFCEEGYNVIGYDVDEGLIDTLGQGRSPVPEEFPEADIDRYVTSGRFQPTTDPTDIESADTYLLSVPTPVDGTDPDLTAVKSASQTIANVLNTDDLVVLQSTVPIGTCEKVVTPILESSGLEIGSDVGLAFVPERYSPGNPESTVVPRLVGSVSEAWQESACSLYEPVVEATVPVDSPAVAEAAKLLENVQRDVNIALINEFARVLWELGIEAEDVLNGAETKWNFHRYDPGIGVGGHCIPVDPYHFLAAAADTDVDPVLTKAARRVNDQGPSVFCDVVMDALDYMGVSLQNATVAVVGLSYKPGIGDVRNSPAIELVSLLDKTGVDITIYDSAYGPDSAFPQISLTNCETFQDAVGNADAVVFNTTSEHLDCDDVKSALPNDCAVIDMLGGLSRDDIEAEYIDPAIVSGSMARINATPKGRI